MSQVNRKLMSDPRIIYRQLKESSVALTHPSDVFEHLEHGG